MQGSAAGRAPSVLQRMFSRTMRRPEHESFSSFPMKPMPAAEDAGNPNIVILNSLTHDQLVQLLKARTHITFNLALSWPICSTSVRKVDQHRRVQDIAGTYCGGDDDDDVCTGR